MPERTHAVVLYLGDKRYSLDAMVVEEVVDAPAIVELPGLPRRLAGVLSYRGGWVPVIGLSELLTRSEGGPSNQPRGGAAVVRRGSVPFAILADAVSPTSDEEERGGTLELDIDALFRAPLPPHLRGERLAAPTTADEVAFAALRFSVADLDLAAPAAEVQEILELAALEPLDGVPPEIAGRARLRGVYIPVLDLRVRFGLPPGPAGSGRILTAVAGGEPLGLKVDRVGEVITAGAHDIAPLPSFVSRRLEAFLEAVIHLGEDRLVLLLRPDRLLAPEALAAATLVAREAP